VQILLVAWVIVSLMPLEPNGVMARVDYAGHVGGAAMGLILGGRIYALSDKKATPDKTLGKICAGAVIMFFCAGLSLERGRLLQKSPFVPRDRLHPGS
jgi:hypothetical protein